MRYTIPRPRHRTNCHLLRGQRAFCGLLLYKACKPSLTTLSGLAAVAQMLEMVSCAPHDESMAVSLSSSSFSGVTQSVDGQ